MAVVSLSGDIGERKLKELEAYGIRNYKHLEKTLKKLENKIESMLSLDVDDDS